nr:uncharacterized protein LOC108943454 [Nicotiana tomentosiformis]
MLDQGASNSKVSLSKELGAKLVTMGAWRSSGDASAMWTTTARCIWEAMRERSVIPPAISSPVADKLVYRPEVPAATFRLLIYKRGLVRVKERKARDLDQVRCIKDEDSKVLVDETCIRHRWQTYFHKFLNKEGDRNIVTELKNSERLRDFGFCRRSKIEEVEGALCSMSRGKATGPDEIPVEFWKDMGRVGLEWLTGLFNVIFRTKKMPDDWRWSLMIPLYKNKGDI